MKTTLNAYKRAEEALGKDCYGDWDYAEIELEREIDRLTINFVNARNELRAAYARNAFRCDPETGYLEGDVHWLESEIEHLDEVLCDLREAREAA